MDTILQESHKVVIVLLMRKYFHHCMNGIEKTANCANQSELTGQTLKSRGVKLIHTTVADSRGNGVLNDLTELYSTVVVRC